MMILILRSHFGYANYMRLTQSLIIVCVYLFFFLGRQSGNRSRRRSQQVIVAMNNVVKLFFFEYKIIISDKNCLDLLFIISIVVRDMCTRIKARIQHGREGQFGKMTISYYFTNILVFLKCFICYIRTEQTWKVYNCFLQHFSSRHISYNQLRS